jgi:hypothetical protein
MSVLRNALRSWANPRAAFVRELSGATEAKALAYLMGACFLIFVAQWPALARAAALDPAIPFDARIGGALLGWLFIAPLFFYALAGLAHLIARAFGGRGSGLSARMALFWSLVASVPLFLLFGLVSGFLGEGPARNIVGALLAIGFLAHWALAFHEAEWGTRLEAGRASD